MDNKKTITIIILGLVAMAGILFDMKSVLPVFAMAQKKAKRSHCKK